MREEALPYVFTGGRLGQLVAPPRPLRPLRPLSHVIRDFLACSSDLAWPSILARLCTRNIYTLV